MLHNTSNLETWKPEIDAFMEDEMNLREGQTPLYGELFDVKTSDRKQLIETGITGYNPMVEVGEQGDAVEDNVKQTYKSLYQRRSYRKVASFTSDLLETDQSGEVEKTARNLVSTIDYTRNLNIFGMIRNATSSLYTFGDSKSLVAIAHPRKDGGTAQPNTFRDGVQLALTYDNAITLETVAGTNVSNAGNLTGQFGEDRNKVLVVPYDLRVDAFQIAGVNGADSIPGTGAAAGNRNYLRKGTRYDVMVVDFIGYEAAKQAGETGTITKNNASDYWSKHWAIVDKELAKQLAKVYTATGYAKYDDEVVKLNQVLKKYAYDKYMFGNSGWQWIAYSKGDSSTLS